MTTEEIKQVLIDIRDNRLGRDSNYICTCIQRGEEGVQMFLLTNKPTKRNAFKEFTKHQNWLGDFCWWIWHTTDDDEYLRVMQEKKRYLSALIYSIDN